MEVYDFKEYIKSCTSRKVSYAGDVVSVKRDLIVSKVVPAWPKVGKACVASIREVVDSQLVADLDDPDHCLLPQTEWPKETPRSKVYASEEEWFKICKAGPERGMFVPIEENDIFRNQFGDLVTNGTMGVDKPKEVESVIQHLLRFICIFCPINVHMRKFHGDS